jgi:hypothetical protein
MRTGSFILVKYWKLLDGRDEIKHLRYPSETWQTIRPERETLVDCSCLVTLVEPDATGIRLASSR